MLSFKQKTCRIHCLSPEETQALAARLARRSRPGDVICLIGLLGSGKTTFVQGFARGAGFRGDVVSPSFGIAREYRIGRRLLYHLDLFRVEKRDFPNLDLEEYLHNPRAICLIEWPEVARAMLPADRLEIRFSHRKQGGRTLSLRTLNPHFKSVLKNAA